MSAFYEFIDLLQRTHARQNLDLHVIFTGPEGCGKSATAFATAAFCDYSFMAELDSRLLLDSSEFDKVYSNLNERIEELKNGINTNCLRFYQLDESQNLLLNRNAMSKHNKDVVQLIMTMRAAKASLFYCTPDITSIEKTVLRRVALIVACNRGEVYIFINKINLKGNIYEGSAQRLLYKMNEYKKKYGAIPDLTLELAYKLKTHPDIIAKVPFDPNLYRIYEQHKLEKTQLFLEEKMTDKETKTKEEPKNDLLEQKGITVIDGGDYSFNDSINGELYTREYYSFQSVIALLGYSESGFRKRLRKAGVNTIKNKRKSYLLGKDILKVIE